MAQLAKMALQERSVTVNRQKLIETLKSNQTSHVAKFNESLSGYVIKAREMMASSYADEMAAAQRRYLKSIADIDAFDATKPEKMPSTWRVCDPVIISIPVPRNYTDMYRTAIDMMEWDTRDVIELTYAEFQCFVQDEWDWKAEFDQITSRYTMER